MAKSAMIIIDAQEEYGPDGGLAIPGIDQTSERIVQLLGTARDTGVPVVNVRHVSRDPDDSTFNAASEGVKFLSGLQPAVGEVVVTKQYADAFIDTRLDRELRTLGVSRVYVCGYTSFLCCDSTARHAAALGYDVRFVEDAISEFPLDGMSQQQIHQAIVAFQGVMFSKVITVTDAISEIRAATK